MSYYFMVPFIVRADVFATQATKDRTRKVNVSLLPQKKAICLNVCIKGIKRCELQSVPKEKPITRWAMLEEH